MEWEWQYLWIIIVFAGVIMGAHAWWTEQPGSAYIVPFGCIAVAVIGKILTDEQ